MGERGDTPVSHLVSVNLSPGFRYALNILLNSGVKPVAAMAESARIGTHHIRIIFPFWSYTFILEPLLSSPVSSIPTSQTRDFTTSTRLAFPFLAKRSTSFLYRGLLLKSQVVMTYIFSTLRTALFHHSKRLPIYSKRVSHEFPFP